MAKKKAKRARDAGTGEFVTREFADTHPASTVNETVKSRKKMRAKRKR